MVIMRESTARKLGATPLARIVAHTQHAQEPGWFTTAPVGAMQKLFAKTGWGADDVDLYEINERSEEHTSELQSLLRISYAVFCLKKTLLHLLYQHIQVH